MLSDRATLIMTYIRLVFVATFILVSYECDPQWLFGFKADWFKILNMSLFGLTNGYASTLLAIKAPTSASPQYKESVGTFVGVFISLGILIGSAVAIAM